MKIIEDNLSEAITSVASKTAKLAVAVLTVSIFVGSAALSAKTIDVTVVNGHPPVFLWVKHLSKTFIPAVNKELEGSEISINWTESYGGTLAKVGGELEALEEGLAEIGVVPTVFEPAKLPLHNVGYYTPFASRNTREAVEIIDAMHESVPAMYESWTKHNLVYLRGGFGIDDYHLFTNFPVNKVSDLKGHKIGAPGPAVNWLKGTGAVGVSGNLTTYYNSLKTGVFDGVIVFATAAVPGKLYEVAPYITKVSLATPYAGGVAANKDWYDDQPEVLKKALHKATQIYRKAYHNELNARIAGSMKLMSSKGATVTVLSAAERKKWAQVMPNFAKEWAASLDKKGIPGSKVLSTYMEKQRSLGIKPARDWDK